LLEIVINSRKVTDMQLNLVVAMTTVLFFVVSTSFPIHRMNRSNLIYRNIGKIQRRFNRNNPVKSAASVAESTKLNVNYRHAAHPSFELIQQTLISEFGANVALYKHNKSGAQVLSVIAPDENKVFGATFRTPPDDSTGIPHILEHSVLCGSRKFPVKEPFVDLMKGSLNTFLNAFTYPDRTCYPVASMNTKDFYNLIHVYLDAVFHPRAIRDKQVLQQEGWHYELEDVNGPLLYKGVVYNEMKGVYSSPDSLMARASQQALFPDNTYGVDSGGDPTVIPTLTFEKFQRFHSLYYHPSNSRLYFYGDDDPMKRLELLDEYLTEFDAIEVNSDVKIQPMNKPASKLSLSYPIAPGQPAKHMVTINWLLNEDPFSPLDRMTLQVLDHLLLGTSASVLRKTLIDSKLGESVTGGGLSDELIQATYSVGLKGVTKENVEKVEQLILATLSQVVETGFEADAIQASMNSMEFSLREFNTGSFPRGLSLMLGMMNNWVYDRSPVEGVQFEEPLAQLKQLISEGKPVFQLMLQKLIVTNKHRVTVEMVPDETLEAKILEEESARLAQAKSSMTTQDLLDVMETAKMLKAAQEAEDSPEAKASIPALSLDDIDKQAREIPTELYATSVSGVTVLTTNVQSNGILYADIGFDITNVPVSELPLLGLFARMLTECGTDDMDEVALSRKIGAETGGISVSYHSDLRRTAGKVSDPSDIVMMMMIRGKATIGKIDSLLQLIEAVLLRSNLSNQKRAVEMLKESNARRVCGGI